MEGGASTEGVFITFGGPQTHDSSSRDDNFISKWTTHKGRSVFATDLSSRPKRTRRIRVSTAEGPAVFFVVQLYFAGREAANGVVK